MKILFIITTLLFAATSQLSIAQPTPESFQNKSVTIPSGNSGVRKSTGNNQKVKLGANWTTKVVGYTWDTTKKSALLVYKLAGGHIIYAKDLENYLPGCDLPPPDNLNKTARQIRNIAIQATQPLNPKVGPNGGTIKWATSCQNFIQNDGSIGPWGKKAISAIEKTGAGDCMYNPWLWQSICPGFEKMSQPQQQHFISYFLATKAMDEASCNPNSRVWATNGYGVGLFMLEESKSLRAGRSSFCRNQPANETRDIDFQFQCTVAQIKNVQCGRGVAFGHSGGYWQEANKSNGDIVTTIRNGYALCSL